MAIKPIEFHANGYPRYVSLTQVSKFQLKSTSRALLEKLIQKCNRRSQETAGEVQIDSKPVYFVRDNGIGFDKSIAGKLFIPFQRLPGSEEFKGLGIGLSTAQRIIQRHGGSIWSDGEQGIGAAFYFTLQ